MKNKPDFPEKKEGLSRGKEFVKNALSYYRSKESGASWIKRRWPRGAIKELTKLEHQDNVSLYEALKCFLHKDQHKQITKNFQPGSATENSLNDAINEIFQKTYVPRHVSDSPNAVSENCLEFTGLLWSLETTAPFTPEDKLFTQFLRLPKQTQKALFSFGQTLKTSSSSSCPYQTFATAVSHPAPEKFVAAATKIGNGEKEKVEKELVENFPHYYHCGAQTSLECILPKVDQIQSGLRDLQKDPTPAALEQACNQLGEMYHASNQPLAEEEQTTLKGLMGQTRTCIEHLKKQLSTQEINESAQFNAQVAIASLEQLGIASLPLPQKEKHLSTQKQVSAPSRPKGFWHNTISPLFCCCRSGRNNSPKSAPSIEEGPS